MGCDIHVFSEYRQTVNGKESWFSADRWKLNPYFDDEGEQQYQHCPIYSRRNYSMFSALAGVRDYSSGTPCIAEPRGMPDDATAATQAECERWGSDGHSHSYTTLRELVEWQKENGAVREAGLISVAQAEALERGELPTIWCQASSEKGLVHREWWRPCSAVQPLIDAMTERAREELWIFGDRELTAEEMEKFRIVFWFDS